MLEFEKGNPQHLSTEGLAARVRFVYIQCLEAYRLFPEVW